MTRNDTSELRRYLTQELERIAECSISAVENCADEADLAAQFNQRRVELAVAGRAQEKRRELEDALRRLDVDDFGICEECDRNIPLARLKASPTTRLCVRCQEEAERDRNVAA